MLSINQRAAEVYTATVNTVFFGTTQGERIYLSLPNFECDWYWSFGCLGNKNHHYHLSDVSKDNNLSLYDALKANYSLCPPLQDDKNLWTFCELVETAYRLRATAEIYYRGGSHISNNPCRELLYHKGLYEYINFILLPALFKQIEKLFGLDKGLETL